MTGPLIVLAIGVGVACLWGVFGYRPEQPVADWREYLHEQKVRIAAWSDFYTRYYDACEAVPRPRVARKIVTNHGGGWSVASWVPDLHSEWRWMGTMWRDPPKVVPQLEPGFRPMSHVFDTRKAAEAWLKATAAAKSDPTP